MKKTSITLSILFVWVNIYAQDLKADKYFLTNGVSIGLGNSRGIEVAKPFNGELLSFKKNTTDLSLEYQVIAGFILNPNASQVTIYSIETGITIAYNTGEVKTNSGNTYNLKQASYGIPLAFSALSPS